MGKRTQVVKMNLVVTAQPLQGCESGHVLFHSLIAKYFKLSLPASQPFDFTNW